MSRPTEKVKPLLLRLVRRWEGEDHFYLAALSVALRGREAALIAELFQSEKTAGREPAMVKLAWELQRAEAVPFLKTVLAGEHPDDLKRTALEALWHIADPSAGEALTQHAAHDGDVQRRQLAIQYLGSRLAGPWKSLQDQASVQSVLSAAIADPRLADAAIAAAAEGQVTALGAKLLALVRSDETPEARKAAVIAALGRLKFSEAVPRLQQQLQTARTAENDPKFDPDAEADPLARAALQALADIGGEAADATVRALIPDGNYAPALRREAVRLLGRSSEGAGYLLDLAENGQLPVAVKGAATEVVHGFKGAQLARRAEELLPRPKSSSGQPLPRIEELIGRSGSRDHGYNLFFLKGEQGGLCSRCHRVQGAGAWVGPDLSQIGAKLSRQGFYDSLLNPSAGIAHEYRAYNVVTHEGRVFTGLIVEDGSERVVLKTAEGQRVALPVNQIDERTAQPVSLMPDNLTATLSEADLVDLVAYLETLRQPVTMVSRWHALGPLPREAHLDAAASIDLNAAHRDKNGKPTAWRKRQADLEGRLDLGFLQELTAGDVVYLMGDFNSAQAQPADLVIDAPAQTEVWVNGQVLLRARSGDSKEPLRATAVLRPGANELLLRLRGQARNTGIYVTLISAAPLEQ